MWLYQFKADYILCIDEAEMVENMNKPDVGLIKKAGDAYQTTDDNLPSNAVAPEPDAKIRATAKKGNNDQNLIFKVGDIEDNTGKIEEEKK